jgi:hypothetical protein
MNARSWLLTKARWMVARRLRVAAITGAVLSLLCPHLVQLRPACELAASAVALVWKVR